MNRNRVLWGLLGVLLVGGSVLGAWLLLGNDAPTDPMKKVKKHREHMDHSAFFEEPFAMGPEVTKACLECHEDAANEVMGTAHFQWVGDEVIDPRTGKPERIGKKNLINNFCIAIDGNWSSCTRCHAGYGWKDENFDFQNPENVDCLVCHDRSGTYLKGAAGEPRKGVDLQAAAKSVGYPKRDNCGICHAYGGGGLGVKHGDLDSTLDNPDENDDVHMGRLGMLCIDCHGGDGHNIKGKAYSVSVNHENGIGCTDCHDEKPHDDARLNRHTAKVSCQACHIPTFANNVPTKMVWDWSKAGDDTRQDDPHHYLKIKGEFVYDQGVKPEYRWFNLEVGRYLLGDTIAESGATVLNPPLGDRSDPDAKIWPFKVHVAQQPYDKETRQLIPPVTSGPGGYWHDFDWGKALALGAKGVGLKFSGDFGFTETVMYWPLSHMVLPKEKAVSCNECHGNGGRLDWKALGYDADPMNTGGVE